MPFVLLVLALLGGALVVLLALRTVLTEDAFEIGELQRENRELSHEQQRLQELVVQAESPDALARQAEELGMVPGEAPQFIDTRTGEVRGGDEGGADSGLPGTGDPGEVDGEAR
ncbi:hypothetical protein [Marinactinospora thermotolerans]|nr:hypothetical protein [Marinactinospora thermotolerans]